MISFFLTEITTKDNLIHQGLYVKPPVRSKRAILWVHGLTDNFYGDKDIFESIVSECGKNHIGFASFNTRGHDIIASVKKSDPTSRKGTKSVMLGSSYEVFTQSMWDIEAAVGFCYRQGHSEVVLAGISTGANKVCYYASVRNDPRIVGVSLISPLSDVSLAQKDLGASYKDKLLDLQCMARSKDKNTLCTKYGYIPAIPSRLVSLYKPGGSEDVFPYYKPDKKPSVYASVTKPLLVVLGGADEYADRPISTIRNWFDMHHTARVYKSVIISDAFHGYHGKEKQLATELISWVHGIK